ncbi:DNA-binding response regulator [Arcanobacterium haemolyticum]|uniref:Two component transcriptional regulator, winged helix family n=1 Tax=Arcanobacterium haemolyticum (strain ATCC 9345 / DSM 20595 / CCM 5947 / CCUG 17215 / LMG 16163 / NBRC 15585 / NCTC 8452 / 11018) TaxID=644284 RepID=D7BPJ4_ARCHD|nr:response regulator transcription factor [Arcanobacterium haemolyticum]ADH92843.1 two component transcriptional regulator, winged helix family [Arcanobacterium haemolyticum DSM 20595]QCX46932.1 DNA-binding response regulator [Arcanobacterium haemolyticum]SQH28408.1 Phosphate regulon transcriptional regulatory protein phoB [Arcanobacterium haemolyticum]
MKPRALVVDDEAQMVSIVTFALETQDFTCESATTPASAWELLQRNHYDLVVLDVLMPRGSGIDITRRMRAAGIATPVILLTALGQESDRIAGLEAGADDYVTKPFSPRELALRAQAIVRRATPQAEVTDITVGPVRVDLHAGRAWYNDALITESQAEVAILGVLVRNPDAVVATRDLVAAAWGKNVHSGGREMVKTTVYRLRKHLEAAGIDPGIVRSHRGLGYSLDF